MKRKKWRNSGILHKIFLFLVSFIFAVGLQLCLTHKAPLSVRTGNESSLAGSFIEEGQENEVSIQEEKEQKINLNKTSLEDLMKLPGIGEKTARKILEYKDKNGSYRSIESVMQVQGIGPRKFEKIRSFIIVN